MQRRRIRTSTLSRLRWLLTCAIAAIALAALLVVHVSPSSAAFKLPKQRDIGFRGWSEELRWTLESAPPQLSKLPFLSEKLGSKNRTLEFAKLWKQPSSQDFVPCVAPSSNYSSPVESRGYLLVNTNGGLNQMRTGVLGCLESESVWHFPYQ